MALLLLQVLVPLVLVLIFVFASPSKSQIRVLQSIGRGLRQSEDGSVTKLYDIIDNITGKNFAYSHGEERLKIYQKEKFKYKTHTVDL